METDSPPTPRLVLVGGFLGAGKTTLILKAAEVLRTRGQRVGVVLNDQDASLVDTQQAMAHGVPAREVADGCFCCRFSELSRAVEDLIGLGMDVIFAEPVGSCIDLTATVMRPLQEHLAGMLSLAPLTVLLDPDMAAVLASGELPDDVEYLISHQLQEADLVCTTRSDLGNRAMLPTDFELSGRTGAGVDAWLHEVLHPTRVVGARLLDVDYLRYGAAEAALGWLNLHATIRLHTPRSAALLCGPLLDNLQNVLSKAGVFVAHLKVFDRAPSGWVKASVCGNASCPELEGDLLAEAALQHELALNLRALADPEVLRQLMLDSLYELEGDIVIRHLRSFRPPQPVPEFRIK